MRIFLTVLITILSLQSWTKADDIRDFEIEGMSIGDSLLNHYNKNELNDALEIYGYPGGNDFIYYFLKTKNFQTYEYIQVHVNPKDKDFIIESVEGHIFYKKISDCYKKMNNVKDDIENIINIDGLVDNGKHPTDISGKSTYKRVSFFFNNNDYAEIVCYDMSKKFEEEGKYDRLVVSLGTKKLYNFLTYKAYN